MTRHIDIELTSHNPGIWNWRAAGAKLPRGILEEALVPSDAQPGTVFRAEVETGLDGIEILTVSPKNTGSAATATAERIEVLGAPLRDPGVTVLYAPGGRRRGTKDDRGPKRDMNPRERRDRRHEGSSESGESSEKEPKGPRRDNRRSLGDRIRGTRGPKDGRGEGRGESQRPQSMVHRNAYLATLGPEQLPVAEALLRGGIPAVRKAIAEQGGKQKEGSVNAEPILSIAEGLLPGINLASWKDRASSAQANVEDLRLHELRAVVTASRNVSLDEEGKRLAKSLQDVQHRRIEAMQSTWLKSIADALASGDILGALEAAQRPPEPGTKLPAESAVALAEAVSAAMSSDREQKDWLALLDATVESPVRRTVKPAGIPETPVAREAARRAAGMVPELAKLLGLRIPPPPPHRAVVKRSSPQRNERRPKNDSRDKSRERKKREASQTQIEGVDLRTNDVSQGTIKDKEQDAQVVIKDASPQDLEHSEASALEDSEHASSSTVLGEDLSTGQSLKEPFEAGSDLEATASAGESTDTAAIDTAATDAATTEAREAPSEEIEETLPFRSDDAGSKVEP